MFLGLQVGVSGKIDEALSGRLCVRGSGVVIRPYDPEYKDPVASPLPLDVGSGEPNAATR